MNKRVLIAMVAMVLLGVGGYSAWQFTTMTHLAEAAEVREFELRCDFARFRQILVRKNATQVIINHGGMELISESVQGVQLDASHDDRPLLNAIRGVSKTNVDAMKTLTVKLDQKNIRATKLTLRQVVKVRDDTLQVTTAAIGAQEDVKDYVTTLSAFAVGSDTRIKLTLDMRVEVRVPKLFRSRADREVQRVAKNTLAAQQEALTQLIVQYADELLILPELSPSE